MTKAEKFIRNHEAIKARAIAAIFKKQKALFVEHLNKASEKKSIERRFDLFIEKKDAIDNIVDPFLNDTAEEIPAYLLTVLPKIMNEGAKEPIRRYKKLLPENYSLSFDVESAPAAKYLMDLNDLMLSQRDGSILKTTRDRLRGIMEEGVAAGDSYGSIAKKIQETDPWVFSKARATLIAVNEVGRAYGWANHEPATVLQSDGYVMEKFWTTSHDDRVRKNHKKNEAAGWIPLDDVFPGTGDDFAPSTNEIRCRCTSTHKIVAIQDGKSVYTIQKGTSAEEIRKKHFDIFQKKV